MNAIEQADRITGIDAAIGPGGMLDYADASAKNTYRRGAYIEWIAKQDEFLIAEQLRKRGSNLYRMGDIPLEIVADAIVAMHDAAKPKGDGLPKVQSVAPSEGGNYAAGNYAKVTVWISDPPTMQAAKVMAQYIERCLTPPVRRLLSLYEVHEVAPEKGIMTRVCQHHGDPIYLVPKA